MLLRTLVTILNLAGFGIAIALELTGSPYALPVFYALLVWYVASIFLYRAPFMSRPIGRTAAPPTAPPLAPVPLPLGGSPSAPPGESLGFCAWCGTNVPPGTTTCPACGKPIPYM